MDKFQELREINANRGSEILKAFGIEDNSIEKGGKRAVLGEKRTFGGREYIKTIDGWKFHGKGTGEKAKSHVESTKTGDNKLNLSKHSDKDLQDALHIRLKNGTSESDLK